MNSLESTPRSVAGGLLLAKAERKQLAGLLVDGPLRHVRDLKTECVTVVATQINTYSATTHCPGALQVEVP